MPSKKKTKQKVSKVSGRRLSAALVVLALIATTSVMTVKSIEQRLQGRPSTSLSPVTQTNGCTVGPIPDKDCTPGAVWKGASKSQICTPSYSSLVRKVPAKTIDDIFQRYEIKKADRKNYEIDHLVSLQLGGSNDVSNLWPLDIKTKDKKDRVENHLKRQVCKNKGTVDNAQTSIADNWLELYEQLPTSK